MIKRRRKDKFKRQLGMKGNEKIPYSLLKKINNSSVGETINNPTKKGKSRIKVTKLIERRAFLCMNVRKL